MKTKEEILQPIEKLYSQDMYSTRAAEMVKVSTLEVLVDIRDALVELGKRVGEVGGVIEDRK